MSATGKSAAGSQLATGGYQPTQAAQTQFQTGVAPKPGVADQLTQLSGTTSPAVNTLAQQANPTTPSGPAPDQQMAFPMDYNTIGTQSNPGDLQSVGGIGGPPQMSFPGDLQSVGGIGGPPKDPNGYQMMMPGGPEYNAPTQLSPEQQAQIAAQTNFFTGTLPQSAPISLPGGQQLNLNPPATAPTSLMPAPTAQQVLNAAPATGPVPRPALMPSQPLSQPQNLYQSLGAAPPRTNTINMGLMNTGAVKKSGVVSNKLPQPVRQQAPMPTRATQGYQSRLAPLRRTK
jgi:hypothetical protein